MSDLLDFLSNIKSVFSVNHIRIHKDPEFHDAWPRETYMKIYTNHPGGKTVSNYNQFIKEYPDAEDDVCQQLKALFSESGHLSITIYQIVR